MAFCETLKCSWISARILCHPVTRRSSRSSSSGGGGSSSSSSSTCITLCLSSTPKVHTCNTKM
jgi:hypothetical protein